MKFRIQLVIGVLLAACLSCGGSTKLVNNLGTKTVVVTLGQGCTVSDDEPTLNKHDASIPADRIRWKNLDIAARTVHFAASPFVASPTLTVTILPGRTSSVYVVDKKAANGHYPYDVQECALTFRRLQPDSSIGPGVIVDD